MEKWKKIFFIIWIGQAFSLLSSTLVQFSITWWLTVKTGSAQVLAYSFMAIFIPYIFLSPFIGVWVDRWDRKKIMIYSDLFIALCSTFISVIYFFDAIEIWHIYILLALRSLGQAFHTPAMQASVPLLAPENQLTRVAGINQMLLSFASIAGPALGAILISVSSMHIVMLADVVGAIIAVVSLLFVTIPNVHKTDRVENNKVLLDLWLGFKAIHNNKGMFIMIMTFVTCVFIYMPLNALYPLIIYDYFKGGPFHMSVAEATFGIGMIIGGLFVSYKGESFKKILAINFAYMLIGITCSLIGILPNSGFILFAILLILFGIAIPLINSPMTAIIQKQIEPKMLGRVFSLFGTLSVLPAPLGLMAAGFIADEVGSSDAFFYAGILMFILGVACFFFPSMMNLEKYEPEFSRTEVSTDK